MNEPLPAPLTTRNLRPRFNANPATRSRNPHKANPRSSARRVRSLVASNFHTSSNNSMSYSDGEQPIAGPSGSSSAAYLRPRFVREPERGERERAAKRRRTGRAGTETPEWTSDGEEEDEEVDQLISDSEDAAPPGFTQESAPEPPPSQLETFEPVLAIDDTAEPDDAAPSNPPGTPVSSPSLAKILHTTNIEPPKRRSTSPVVLSVAPTPTSSSMAKTEAASASDKPPAPEAELLSEYTCPICFFPPTNATLTPCGHICCGACLFTAIRTTMQRGAIMMAEGNGARCPVCRAEIPGWDGKGGGVIGLKPRAVFSL